MNLIKANTNNLTTLWKIGGEYVQEQNHHLSLAENGEWPNKLWFTTPPSVRALQLLKLKWNLDKISIPIWGEDLLKQSLRLKANGFHEKLSQVGMSMKLSQRPSLANRFSVIKVTDNDSAKLWSQLFQKAFGYEIGVKTVIQTMNSIDYLIGNHNGFPVGTAVLFVDQFNTAGIHSMGVIPSERRKGYAEELLLQILFKAQQKGCKLVTLQASEMGKGLYLKTGFQENFIIKTFTNTKN